MPDRDARRRLPSVDQLLRTTVEAASVPAGVATAIARQVLEEMRAATPADAGISAAERFRRALRRVQDSGMRRVLNLTGILLHTNLGRAPLGTRAAGDLARTLTGYCDLEMDLHEGTRADRERHLERLWPILFPGHATLAVNNNAAALALAAAVCASGGPLAVSRGELPEIGGSFRIGPLLEGAGARLIEVGSTNRTHLRDFTGAVRKGAAAILRVHPANFRIEGYACAPDLTELCAHAGVPVLYDTGSGRLPQARGGEGWRLPLEQPVQGALAAGCALVTFSADKLPGGPQAGIAVGDPSLVGRMRRHPLYRAFRLDKHAVLLLEQAVRSWLGLAPPSQLEDLMGRSDAQLLRLARKIRNEACRLGLEAELVEGIAEPGGGTSPGQGRPVPEVALARPGWTAARLSAELRALPLPVVGRISGNRVRLNPATLLPGEDRLLAASLSRLPHRFEKEPL